MGAINKFSERVIDLAERLEDVADAAEGKGRRRSGSGARWLILPAAGAGLYALATNASFARQAKDAVDQAKTRASELPDDLMSRIRQSSSTSASRSGGQSSRRKSSSARKTSSTR
jgi:hypothetical protein